MIQLQLKPSLHITNVEDKHTLEPTHDIALQCHQKCR